MSISATLPFRILKTVALAAFPCRVAARPLTFLPGPVDHRRAADRWQIDSIQRDLLTRAAASYLDRRALGRGAPLVVHDDAPVAERIQS